MEQFDEIGYWSEIKLDIIKEYASAYSKIMNARNLHHIYIDAFAGSGKHLSRTTGRFVPGSPLNALLIEPQFREYHFIDLKKQKITSLEEISGSRKDVFIYHGNSNEILLEKIIPVVRYEKYRRALCLLDPYGLHLDWKVLFKMGQMGTFDVFINFPMYDMNLNVLWRDPEKVSTEQAERMNKFWGNDSWKDIAYSPSHQMSLFGEIRLEKVSNEIIVNAFRKRLEREAGFRYIPKPMAMVNSRNATVYFLIFASHKPVAKKIVQQIFKKFEPRMI
ncbi:MAG: three-Cys-motif partner protein TcmP [Deltaproteobacteria bacterium]|nr:three-Cys-motif partner protein TcmP [Deltaproteobacteria bacterium]MBW2131485.1 three-Cys-motif partner protein TcmP [Deltaproteobacteria bacterium]